MHPVVHLLHAAIILATDTPADYSAVGTTIGVVFGGLVAGLTAVVAGALGIRAIRWGVPKLVGFFQRIDGCDLAFIGADAAVICRTEQLAGYSAETDHLTGPF